MSRMVLLDEEIMGNGIQDWENLLEFGELDIYKISEPDEVIQRIGDAEIVITDKTPITDEILVACPSVKYITVTATGYNIVDTVAAAKRGIPVSNVPGYAGAIVAQSTIALILEIYNKVGMHDTSVHAGDWEKAEFFCYTVGGIYEMEGKTLGIIGLGDIGMRVARIAEAFGMEVLAYSRTQYPERETEHIHYASLDEVLSKSDIVSLHCPHFPETEKIINKDTIAMMKDGAVLINTSRGGLVDEQALTDALNSDKLMAAAVDVVSEEPILSSNPLLKAKNCIITPHTAWASDEAIRLIRKITYDNVRGYVTGNLINVVNGIEK